MREYVVDLSSVADFAGFIDAFNVGLFRCVGGEWNGNLDAFNDFLYWPDEHPYRLVLQGWDRCSAALTPVRTWDGRALTEVLAEIFVDNPQTEVRFA